MSHILVVDDEPAICWGLREFLTDDGHEVSVAASAEEALRMTETIRPDVVVMDVRLPGMDGLSAIQHLRPRIGTAPIVVITAFGTLDTAVRAVHEGAFDYLTKPFDLDQAAMVLNRAITSCAPIVEEPAASPPNDTGVGLIGSSPAMQRIFKQIALVAAADVPVLITGESGTGKELVARLLHQHSARRDKPFLPVCLAALNPGLVESELFGHARGSFTGATEDRRGVFEFAERGTLLLDEIGDTPLPLQVKLLRVLENREYSVVGDPRPRPTQVRIIAATNRSLPEMIAAGTFREDLYYRLSVFHIELPPLCERLSDLPDLANHFLRLAPGNSAQHRFAEGFLDALQQRPWAGNVRELRNAIEYAALLARSGPLRAEHLPPPLPLPQVGHVEKTTAEQQIATGVSDWVSQLAEQLVEFGATTDLYDRLLSVVEPPLLQAVLAQCGHNRAAAAQKLGLHRGTLRQKLKQHGIDK
ncbi:MAG: response regulator with CheY-like receiver, AAA-type ATPase, and DNA-binding domain [Planctomycetaceae bacterium]|nr:response regulator with CheY-like receiver, AAA-type ATPase, and DNA-binding domain [Planctomycetaceae bacterium]